MPSTQQVAEQPRATASPRTRRENCKARTEVGLELVHRVIARKPGIYHIYRTPEGEYQTSDALTY